MSTIYESLNRMTLWVVLLAIVGALLAPADLNGTELQHRALIGLPAAVNNASKLNETTTPITSGRNSTEAAAVSTTTNTTTTKPTVHKVNSRPARSLQSAQAIASTSARMPARPFGDSTGLEAAMESHRDLMPAAGEHGKKYILVKKKPKVKKIKMEVYKPKMKYKKIKMKVPVKKMKKKKVKGYLVKKHKHY